MINTISSFSRSVTGVPSGVINAYAGVVAPTGWLICDGSDISRSAYPYLFASFATTFTTATTTSGSTTVSGLSGMTASNVGWGIAGTNIPSGATIISVTNATTVVISSQATATATGIANIAISPYGFTGANNTTTFLLPDLKTRTIIGISANDSNTSPALTDALNRLGKTGGSKAEILTAPQIASHTHPIDHDHASFSTPGTDGSHTHQIKYVTGAAPGVNDYVRPWPTTTPSNIIGSDGVGTGQSTHAHTINVPAFTGSGGANTPSGAAHNNLPLYIVLNYIIKV